MSGEDRKPTDPSEHMSEGAFDDDPEFNEPLSPEEAKNWRRNHYQSMRDELNRRAVQEAGRLVVEEDPRKDQWRQVEELKLLSRFFELQLAQLEGDIEEGDEVYQELGLQLRALYDEESSDAAFNEWSEGLNAWTSDSDGPQSDEGVSLDDEPLPGLDDVEADVEGEERLPAGENAVEAQSSQPVDAGSGNEGVEEGPPPAAGMAELSMRDLGRAARWSGLGGDVEGEALVLLDRQKRGERLSDGEKRILGEDAHYARLKAKTLRDLQEAGRQIAPQEEAYLAEAERLGLVAESASSPQRGSSVDSEVAALALAGAKEAATRLEQEQPQDAATDSAPASTSYRKRPMRRIATIAAGATIAVGATIAIGASIAGNGSDSTAVVPTSVENQVGTGQEQSNQSGQDAGGDAGEAGQVDQSGGGEQGSGNASGAGSAGGEQTSATGGGALLDTVGFYSWTTVSGDFFDFRVVDVDEQTANSAFFPPWIENQQAVGLPVPTNQGLMAAVTVVLPGVLDVAYGQIEPGADGTHQFFVTWFDSPQPGFIDATVTCLLGNECTVEGFIGQFESSSEAAFQDAFAISTATNPVTASDFDAAYTDLPLAQGRCFTGTIAGVETVEVADAAAFIADAAGTLNNNNPGLAITTTEPWDPSTFHHRQIGVNVRAEPDVLIRVDLVMGEGTTSLSGQCLLGDPCLNSTTLHDEIQRTLNSDTDGSLIIIDMGFVTLLDEPVTFNMGLDIITEPGAEPTNYAYRGYQEFDLPTD